MRAIQFSIVAAACFLSFGCQPISKAELDVKLKEANMSAYFPIDIPLSNARNQISEYIAKIRTYPEFYLTQGIINPRITEAKFAGPYTSKFLSSETTYFCVEYLLERPFMSEHIYLRAYPMSITGPKGTALITRIERGGAGDCGASYEPFPELEHRRDEIIAFRKQNPGKLNDEITFFGQQL